MRPTFIAAAAVLLCLVALTSGMLRPVKVMRDSIEVQFHLRSSKYTEEEVEQAFAARSTPGNALFRQHLTQEQLVELVGAKQEDIDSAVEFLSANGASAISVMRTRDVVVGHVTSSSNIAAFGIKKADFTAVKGFRKVLALKGLRREVNVYSVIGIAIDGASGKASAKKGPKKQQATTKSDDGNQFPGMTITPHAIFERYKLPKTPANAPKDFTTGVGEFAQSVFKHSDIATFSSRYNLSQPKVHIVGPNPADSPDNTEGTLDLEYITAVSGGIDTWWISQNSTNPDPNQLDFSWWCDEVLSIPTPPTVVSVSWGMGEYNYAGETYVLDADNRAFRKLGLRGISVFVASGDSGPGSREYLSCSRFMPAWPASSPYVTSVGATYANSAYDAEESVNFSGGGFSDVFPTPSWQMNAVQAYLNSGNVNLPQTSFFNTSGRGFPDVSALGTNFEIFYPSSAGGPSVWGAVSGTSCASPTFAAVIARINLERQRAGKPSLGFLNPALYQLGSVGHDVTKGQSVDTDCFGIFNIAGFPATSGWDAVSGLGTPNYEFLSKNL